MGSHFAARILGLKKEVLELESQRNLLIMLCLPGVVLRSFLFAGQLWGCFSLVAKAVLAHS